MGNKYTFENVQNKFNKLELELISKEYKGIKEKLQFICPYHKEKGIQNLSFDKIINRNGGCKFCNIEARGKLKRISEDVIINRCIELGLNFISTFIKNKETYVKYTCSKHLDKGIISSSWYQIKTGKYGCPYCAGKYKTTKDFKNELQSILPYVEILGEYVNSETKILCKCKIDGCEWSPIARSLLLGQGCPVCGRKTTADKRRKSQEDFNNQMFNINPNIKIIGKYIGDKDLIKCRCKIDNCEWESYASNLLNESAGCPKCAKERVHALQALSNETFLDRISVVNPTIEPLDIYYNYYEKIRCRCKKHKIIFYQSPHGIMGGKNGCPSCTSTKGEKLMLNVLNEFGFNINSQYIFKDCIYKAPLRFDGYDIENNIAFEFNGKQHYFPVDFAGKGDEWAKKQHKLITLRDNIKIDYCNKNNINLIIIPYWEIDNIKEFIFNELIKLGVIEEIKSA